MRRAKRCPRTSARFPCCLGTWKRNIETTTTPDGKKLVWVREPSRNGVKGCGLSTSRKPISAMWKGERLGLQPNFIPLYVGYAQVGVRWLLIICQTIILWLVKKLTLYNESRINFYDPKESYIINTRIIGWIKWRNYFLCYPKDIRRALKTLKVRCIHEIPSYNIYRCVVCRMCCREDGM